MWADSLNPILELNLRVLKFKWLEMWEWELRIEDQDQETRSSQICKQFDNFCFDNFPKT